jgi:hypothetical protein
MLISAVERLSLSARAYGKVLRVARTIADLDGADVIRAVHVGRPSGCACWTAGRSRRRRETVSRMTRQLGTSSDRKT